MEQKAEAKAGEQSKDQVEELSLEELQDVAGGGVVVGSFDAIPPPTTDGIVVGNYD